MSDLNFLEKRAIEKWLDMSDGYPLDFSNRTLQEFVADTVGLDIYEDRYSDFGTSKANRLRSFWEHEPNEVVAKLLQGLLAYDERKDVDREVLAKVRAMIDRLEGQRPSRTEAHPRAQQLATLKTEIHFFISHASEDKLAVARPIANELERRGYRVWLDEAELTIGDSLRVEIDKALAACRFGVLILSESFFGKAWPQYELDGLVGKEMVGRKKCILPVWHDVDVASVASFSPPLAIKLGVPTTSGFPSVVDAIVAAARKDGLVK